MKEKAKRKPSKVDRSLFFNEQLKKKKKHDQVEHSHCISFTYLNNVNNYKLFNKEKERKKKKEISIGLMSIHNKP